MALHCGSAVCQALCDIYMQNGIFRHFCPQRIFRAVKQFCTTLQGGHMTLCTCPDPWNINRARAHLPQMCQTNASDARREHWVGTGESHTHCPIVCTPKTSLKKKSVSLKGGGASFTWEAPRL